MDIGLSKKETRNYSLIRAINGLVSGKFKGLESEASAAIADKQGKPARGFYVPGEVLKRDLTVGVPADGGDLVGTDKIGFIDTLMESTVVSKMGATSLTDLTGDVSIPRMTAGVGGNLIWLGEGGDAPESTPQFDSVNLSPKSLAVYVDASRKMMLQSSLSVEQMITNNIARSFAVEIDRVAIAGTGTGNQPTGILNTTGINLANIGTDGGDIDWLKSVELESLVAGLNGIGQAPGYVSNFKVAGKLKTTSKDAGSGQFLWNGEAGNFNGYQLGLSNNVPSDGTKGTGTALSSIVFGSWENLLIGSWGTLDINVDRYSLGLLGAVRIVAYHDIDIAVRQPEAFAAITDITTV